MRRVSPTSLLVLLGFAVIWVVTFDEPPNREIQRAVSPTYIPDGENAFLALVGLARGASESPHVVGREVVDARMREDQSPGEGAALPGHPVDVTIELDGLSWCHDRGIGDCRDACCWSQETVVSFLRANAHNIALAQALFSYLRYEPVGRHERPDWRIASNLGRVAHVAAYGRLVMGDYDLATRDVIQQYRFWRAYITQPLSPLDRVAAYGSYAQALSLVSQLIRDAPVLEPAFESLLVSLPPADISNRGALVAALRHLEHYRVDSNFDYFAIDWASLGIKPGRPGAVERFFRRGLSRYWFKPGATMNILWEITQGDTAPTRRLGSRFKAYLPNGAGVAYAWNTADSLQTVTAMGERAQAKTGLVLTQWQLRKAGLLLDDVGPFVEGLRLNGKKVWWDRDQRRLGVYTGDAKLWVDL
ncbi:MAG: hypothetical protein AAF493_06920 [Pseudomonadota bacterium]